MDTYNMMAVTVTLVLMVRGLLRSLIFCGPFCRIKLRALVVIVVRSMLGRTMVPWRRRVVVFTVPERGRGTMMRRPVVRRAVMRGARSAMRWALIISMVALRVMSRVLMRMVRRAVVRRAVMRRSVAKDVTSRMLDFVREGVDNASETAALLEKLKGGGRRTLVMAELAVNMSLLTADDGL